MKPGLPLTHDGQDHVARIANFYQALQEGIIIPRWAANLNWGYGHPILMFLYPVPSYTASFFHFLGFSLIDSVKLVFGVSFIFSGLTMYIWIKSFLGKSAGLVAAFLYMFAPYRFVDLYVRGAIGEHVAFIFPPLILYFMFKLSQKYSFAHFLGASLSVAGLILSHNATSIMFLPYIVFYGGYLIFSNRNKLSLFYEYCVILLLGIGLSSFFLLPAFFEGKYTLRDIVTRNEYASRFINLKDLIYGSWNYGGSGQFSVQLGILHLFATIMSLYAFIKQKNKNLRVLLMFTFLYLILSIFIMINQSDFIWVIFTTLQKFQFPWRFLSVSVFTISVLGSFIVFLFPSKFRILLVVLLVCGILFFSKDYFHANGYLLKPDSFYEKVYAGTTDTGESAPIWSVRFMEKEPKEVMEVIEGKADIAKIDRNTVLHKYELIVSSNTSRIRENTLYFPGWKVFVDGKESAIEFQDPAHRGLMTFYANKGIHNVQVLFVDTKLRTAADIISIISLLLLCGLWFTPVSKIKNQILKIQIKSQKH